MALSAENIKAWERDGFLVMNPHELFPAEGDEYASDVVKAAETIEQWPEEAGKWMKYFETSQRDGSRLLNRVEKFLDFLPEDNVLHRLNNRLVDVCTQLFKEESVLFKEKINLKYPGGGGFEPHQDMAARWDRYGHEDFISVLVCVDAMTASNGQLEVVAGEHDKGLLGPMDEAVPQHLVDSYKWIPLDLKPGEVVFFGGFVPHRSGPNNSDGKRRAFYYTYNKKNQGEGEVRERYYADKRISFPPDIERDPSKQYAYKI